MTEGAVVVKTRKFKRNPLLSRRQVCCRGRDGRKKEEAMASVAQHNPFLEGPRATTMMMVTQCHASRGPSSSPILYSTTWLLYPLGALSFLRFFRRLDVSFDDILLAEAEYVYCTSD
jgi:hypothetical protein